jgi:hypothetical protein
LRSFHPKFVHADDMQTETALAHTPVGDGGAFECSGPLAMPAGVHADKDLLRLLASRGVFERPGCPHKVADTRMVLTTDR